jgi:bifunctional UDP-N-acetylglucosamine pyrophosphorylase/glucosamine-1-phosphate N-acetyltransferase
MAERHIVILAGGKGTRMKSDRPKVLHRIAGTALIDHVLNLAASLRPSSVNVVVGHQADDVVRVMSERPGLRFALQEPQLGTGHALLQVAPLLRDASGTAVLLSGDVPLLRAETLAAMVGAHEQKGASATVLTAEVEAPDGYGRIVRDRGLITAIVEHKDATPAQREIREINSGIYAFDLAGLFDTLRAVGSANAQGEYYLPDLVKIYRARGLVVETATVDDPREILGVNSRKELAELAAILNARTNEALMQSGVTIVDPATTYIAPDVNVGTDTIIHPGVYLEGSTRIGARCEIHSGVRIVDSAVEDEVVINNFCVITNARIARGARLGPFAHIRPESIVGEGAHVGNFVELKKTSLGRGTKANHLSYLGDATIGENVNIGAGTITCNYDGTLKHPTIIEDGAFIGSDTQLIAPVRVGRGAYVAAGSSITDDVPPESLAITRGKQVTKEGWATKKRKSQGSGVKGQG